MFGKSDLEARHERQLDTTTIMRMLHDENVQRNYGGILGDSIQKISLEMEEAQVMIQLFNHLNLTERRNEEVMNRPKRFLVLPLKSLQKSAVYLKSFLKLVMMVFY